MKNKINAKVSVSIIMPALNEEKNIAASIRNSINALNDFSITAEIIVVNDGSRDSTKELVKKIMKEDKTVKLINHQTSKGLGASFWDGVDKSRNDLVVMMPGDNENDPWEILRYHPLLDHVDFIIPFVFNKEVRSLFRNVLSFLYRFIINTTFGVNLNYTNGTVFYRRKILEDISHRSCGFFFQTDILIRLIRKGYLFAEVPYRLNLREGGVSKAVSFPSLLNVIHGYFRLLKDQYFRKSAKYEKNIFIKGTESAKRYSKVNKKMIIPDKD